MYLYHPEPAPSPEVVVYSLEGCPACAHAKAYLADLGVPFEVRDGAGMGEVPIIVVGDRRVVGFSRASVDEMLAHRSGQLGDAPGDTFNDFIWEKKWYFFEGWVWTGSAWVRQYSWGAVKLNRNELSTQQAVLWGEVKPGGSYDWAGIFVWEQAVGQGGSGGWHWALFGQKAAPGVEGEVQSGPPSTGPTAPPPTEPPGASTNEPPNVALGVTIAGTGLGGLVGAVVGHPIVGAFVGGALGYLIAPHEAEAYKNVPQLPEIPGVT